MSGQTKLAAIAKAIAATADRNGVVRPEKVWAAAKRDPKSVLYAEFQWNVKKAAEAHWTARAQELIRQCKSFIFHEERKIIRPVYVSDGVDTKRYIEVAAVPTASAKAEMLMLKEILQIEGYVSRALALAITWELDNHFGQILELLADAKRDLRQYGDGDSVGGDDDGVGLRV